MPLDDLIGPAFVNFYLSIGHIKLATAILLSLRQPPSSFEIRVDITRSLYHALLSLRRRTGHCEPR
jgi:hypothetical protein